MRSSAGGINSKGLCHYGTMQQHKGKQQPGNFFHKQYLVFKCKSNRWVKQ
jgi:hypothetical protein